MLACSLAGLSARTLVCPALLLGVLALLNLLTGCAAPTATPTASITRLAVVMPAPPDTPLVVDVRRPPSDEFADGRPIHWLVTLRWPVEAGRSYDVCRDGQSIRRIHGGDGSPLTTATFAVLESPAGEWTVAPLPLETDAYARR